MLLMATEFERAIPRLNVLFEDSFKRPIHSDYLRWRYVNNPVGEVLSAITELDGRLAASYSASPVRMRIHGRLAKTALSMTTMTHPEYAGRGLFTSLANELYVHMQELGYAMVWGFPNTQSHRGFISRLGWSDIYEIPTMRLSLAHYKAPDVRAEFDDAFGLAYALTPPLNDQGIHVHKDPAYFRWRYRDNPVNDYRNLVIKERNVVTSCCVLKVYQNTLDLVDFQACDAAQGEYLLRAAIQWALDQGLVGINCWAPRHHFMHPLCERLGFLNGEPVTYLGARILAGLKSARGVSRYYEDWFLQMGDSDVY